MKRSRQVRNLHDTTNPSNSLTNVYTPNANHSFRVRRHNDNYAFVDMSPAVPATAYAAVPPPVSSGPTLENPWLSHSSPSYPEAYWKRGQPVPPHSPTDPLGSLIQVAALVTNMGTSDLDVSRLSITLCELVQQCLDIASVIDCGVVIDIENRYGLDVVRNRSKTLYKLVRAKRSKTDVDTIKSVVSEIVWCVDNFNKILSHNRLVAQDLTAGHFTAPDSVIALIDDTLNLITLDDMKEDAPALMEARRALQKRLNDLYNVRLSRGIIDREKYVRTIQRISSFLKTAVGRIKLCQVTKRIKSTSMSTFAKEAIVLAAAGRVGANIDASTHMREALSLVSRGEKASVTVVGYGITPQDLWDHLLPYVIVVNGVIYRGLIGGEIWLRAGDDGDPVRAKRRRYVAAEEQTDWAPHASIVRAAYHPTIFSISPETFQSLLWWTSMENPVTQKLYTRLLECASTGSSPVGKSASDLWRSAVGCVAFSYRRCVDEIILASLTVRSVSAIALASTDLRMFCDALYTRVIALLSCEE